MSPAYYLTQEGLAKLQEELTYLKDTKRKEIAFRIEKAKELGDLSENGEYHSAREDQSFMEGRIGELEYMVRYAVLIEHDDTAKKGIIELGSTVKVHMNGKEAVFTIVGAAEANPLAAKISNESPLGQTLLGHRTGDRVQYEAPKGKITCEILEVH